MTVTPTASSARAALLEQLEQRLAGVTDLTVYSGEVTDQPPLLDDSGRVGRYAVIYAGIGRGDINPSLAAIPTDFLWETRVHFVAGYAWDLSTLLDEAIPLLTFWSPQVEGLDCGPLRPVPSFRPGPMRRNDAAVPPRFWLPTEWELHVVTQPTPA